MSLSRLRELCSPQTLEQLWNAPRQGDAQAAVLVPFQMGPEGLELLYTVRPRTLRSHPGQVAFPGGKRDPEDVSPAATVLREANEELGLEAKDIELLGVLKPLPTFTGFAVTPVLGLIKGSPQLHPSPDEVASVFAMSLNRLRNPSEQRHMRTRWNRRDPVMPLYFWPYAPTPIWGMTAHLTHQVLTKLHTL